MIKIKKLLLKNKYLRYVNYLRKTIIDELLLPIPLRLLFIKTFLRLNPWSKFSYREKWDAFERPWYAYGLYNAAIQALNLGINEISVIEFGVARGDGLFNLEKLVNLIQNEIDIKIKIYGFDSGKGLPMPLNQKDQLYFWSQGDFSMDHSEISKLLDISTLVLGPISQTIQTFGENYSPPPIGFLIFDLDFYSSTMDAFKLFELLSPDKFLPRVECYMDDVSSTGLLAASISGGVLAAINDFNESSTSDVKLLRKIDIGRSRILPGSWHNTYWVAHFFSHKKYNIPINYDN
jgi:hypothetical protein